MKSIIGWGRIANLIYERPSILSVASVPRTNDTPDQSGPTKLSTHAPGVYDDGNVYLPYYPIPRIVLYIFLSV